MTAGMPARTGWRALLVVLVLAVCWLAFAQHPPQAVNTGWDKLNHLSAFVALAVCAVRGFGWTGWRRSALVLLGFGIFIELVQSQIPGRSAEAADVLADALGIAAGLLLAAGWSRVMRAAR